MMIFYFFASVFFKTEIFVSFFIADFDLRSIHPGLIGSIHEDVQNLSTFFRVKQEEEAQSSVNVGGFVFIHG